MKDILAVYIMSTKSIGVIIDEGFDTCKWYRTDADGIRESEDLIFLHSKQDVKECINQLGAKIAPSTKIIWNYDNHFSKRA